MLNGVWIESSFSWLAQPSIQVRSAQLSSPGEVEPCVSWVRIEVQGVLWFRRFIEKDHEIPNLSTKKGIGVPRPLQNEVDLNKNAKKGGFAKSVRSELGALSESVGHQSRSIRGASPSSLTATTCLSECLSKVPSLSRNVSLLICPPFPYWPNHPSVNETNHVSVEDP